MTNQIDPELLRTLLRYEPESGKLFWLPRSASHFSDGRHDAAHNAAKWNARFAGREALCTPCRGYFSGTIFGIKYSTHRVAWAIHYGCWPEYEVDHEDHDGQNNRAKNLRDVPPAINSKNQSLRKTNQSGVTGVYWHKPRKRWVAKIHVDGRTIHLGNFIKFEDAALARIAAQKQHGFHPNHGRAA